MQDDPRATEWREALKGCSSILEALAKAGDEDGRLAARTWWVLCMSSRIAECKQPHSEWRAEAADALPTRQLTSEHTEAAVRLPAFEPLARCLLSSGQAIGSDAAQVLDQVEAVGVRSAWTRALSEVEPMRARLQQSFLRRPDSNFVRRAFGSSGHSPVDLAPSAAAMGIDELRGEAFLKPTGDLPTSCLRPPYLHASDPSVPGVDVRASEPTGRVPGGRGRVCDGGGHARSQHTAAGRLRRGALGPDGARVAADGGMCALSGGLGWGAGGRRLASAAQVVKLGAQPAEGAHLCTSLSLQLYCRRTSCSSDVTLAVACEHLPVSVLRYTVKSTD